MKRYIFKEQEITNEYRYIFLCGSRYVKSDEKDKRNVLREFLKQKNPNYCPVILEDNFIFKKSKSRFLLYDDIYMKDLYQVEMVTNYLSDSNIIIHESISTAAETGLFLSEEQALKKTCLLLPEETAVEEQKLGQFIRLAFLNSPNPVKVIRFYPRVVKNILSEDVKYWHTYFWKDRIGINLGKRIEEFLGQAEMVHKIEFTRKKERVKDGLIYYSKNGTGVEINILPRIFLNCIAAIFNIDEVSRQVFNVREKTLKDYIDVIKEQILEIFISTIEEKTGGEFKNCSIFFEMNIKRVYISEIIGMSLYLFQAARFIEVLKADDYMETNRVTITRKMVTYKDGTKHFFYEKYKECIGHTVDIQIV